MSFCIRLFQNLDIVCTEREIGGGIIWCYSKKNVVPDCQHLPCKNFNYQEDAPDNFGVGGSGHKPCLMILDNMLNDVYSKQLCDLFTKYSHHRNISANFIAQNLFHHGRYSKDISLNTHYLVALKKSEIRNGLCTWPNRCIPKIVLSCITPIWMRHNTPTVTSSWIWHKIWTTACGLEPTYYRHNINRSSNLI